MAVKAPYMKEYEGMGHTPSMVWLNGFGSQSIHGDYKAISDVQKSFQTTMSDQKSLPEYQAPIGLGFTQPALNAKYPHDQCFGVLSPYGSQVPGRVMLPIATDDGPIYVNPKQYHGIIRRRKSRAKAVLQSKPIKKQKKPYMHLSRHLHAMRRPRGTGGRFLNSKTANVNGNGEPTGSQSSEVVQLSKEGASNGSNLSGTEVTSLYSRGDLDHFPIIRPGQPIYDFSVTMSTRHSIVLPSKWV